MEIDVQKLVQNPHVQEIVKTHSSKETGKPLPQNLPKELIHLMLIAEEVASVLRDLKVFAEDREKNEQLDKEKYDVDAQTKAILEKALLEAQITLNSPSCPVRLIIDPPLTKDDPNCDVRVKYEPV